MQYARKVNRNMNSGIYLGPTQGLSSPKQNRRACLCTHSDTYSRDCCNGNLIAQGVGNIQGTPVPIIPTSTTTTTSGPTTTSTTSTSTSTTTSTTSASTTSTSTSTTTVAPTTTSTSTTIAPLPIVTGSLTIWNNYTDYNSSTQRIGDRSGNNNIAIVSGSTLTVSGSLGLKLVSNNFFTYPKPLNQTPTTQFTLQYFGSLNVGGPGDGNTPMFSVSEGFNVGWYTIIIPEPEGAPAQLYYRTGEDKNILFIAEESTLQMITLVCDSTTNQIEMYVNASSIGFIPGSSPVVPFNSSSIAPFMFAKPQDASRTFLGSVKDIVVYSRKLTAGEVAYNYNGLSSL